MILQELFALNCAGLQIDCPCQDFSTNDPCKIPLINTTKEIKLKRELWISSRTIGIRSHIFREKGPRYPKDTESLSISGT